MCEYEGYTITGNSRGYGHKEPKKYRKKRRWGKKGSMVLEKSFPSKQNGPYDSQREKGDTDY